VIISLFGWHLVFGTKNILFLPSPDKLLAFSTRGLVRTVTTCNSIFDFLFNFEDDSEYLLTH